MKPKVSVCMITYNHEEYIEEAVLSVINQKTNFDYEIVIGDDASTDKTRNLLISLQNKFPSKIKLILNKRNLGMNTNLAHTLKLCKGKYIAMLEGDDYWTSNEKLQIQYDYMLRNADCAISYHNANFFSSKDKSILRPFFYEMQKEKRVIEELIINNFIPTLTCMFRNKLLDKLPSWYSTVFPGDWPLHILNSQYGFIGYINKNMANYRVHDNSTIKKSVPLNNYFNYIKMLKNVKTSIQNQYHTSIDQSISSINLKIVELYLTKKQKAKAIKYLLYSLIYNIHCNKKLVAKTFFKVLAV